MNQPMATDPTDFAATESKTALLLNESEVLLSPLVKLLISQGVGYPQLALRLKQVFIEAAKTELLIEGTKPADAAISVRSGVHRKDVRAWRENLHDNLGNENPVAHRSRKELSVADQLYTKWLSDAAYKDGNGLPKPIPVAGPAPSFDALVASITKDFHRRTLLDELIRLGLVKEQTIENAPGAGENTQWIVPIADGMVPKADLPELLRFFSNNSRDHIAAGVNNILAGLANLPAPYLERSVFAKGLSAESVDQLSQLAKQLWQPAFQQMVDAANQRYCVDKNLDESSGRQRMRFGIYFYSETENQGPAK
jgi:Family of unknown function (DUF6502)